jgi:Trypsin-co-occurring domain 1
MLAAVTTFADAGTLLPEARSWASGMTNGAVTVMEAVKFPLESGGEVLVRVDSSDQYGGVVTRGGREYIQGAIEQAGQSFESALSTIRFVAEAVLSQLASLAATPEEVRVEFGLELTAKAGAVLAAAGGGAQLRVALTWNRKESDEAKHTPPSGATQSSSTSGSP